MRIAITGATGMIGHKLVAFFLGQRCAVTALTRNSAYQRAGVSMTVWDPALSYLETEDLEGFDVVIHLAGSNVAQRWTPQSKKDILESRVASTRLLCQTLAAVARPPQLLMCASAVGFYGPHPPEKVLDENSPGGSYHFLANVCRQWEKQTEILSATGIRVVLMRLGVVLSKSGGALAKMRLPFELGLGGVLGNGRQMMSWIAVDEIPEVVDFLIKNENIRGPVNVVSPQPVSNQEFTRVLGEVMHRPTLLPVPGFAVRWMLGEMGQHLLLEGARVVPRRLQEAGYPFRWPEIKSALQEVIR